jgi:hypothetical protein
MAASEHQRCRCMRNREKCAVFIAGSETGHITVPGGRRRNIWNELAVAGVSSGSSRCWGRLSPEVSLVFQRALSDGFNIEIRMMRRLWPSRDFANIISSSGPVTNEIKNHAIRAAALPIISMPTKAVCVISEWRISRSRNPAEGTEGVLTYQRKLMFVRRKLLGLALVLSIIRVFGTMTRYTSVVKRKRTIQLSSVFNRCVRRRGDSSL